MEQTLLVTVFLGKAEDFLSNFVKKYAQEFKLEGLAKLLSDGQVELTVSGDSQNIDEFIDALYKNFDKYKIDDISIEPFFKEKNYRGLFRVITH